MPSSYFGSPYFGAELWGSGFFSGPGLAGDAAAPTLVITDSANGGGGVATISGSTAGSTNTLYYQVYDPAYTMRPWRELETRIGDGTISFTLPLGHYAFYVLSETGGGQAVSYLTYGGISDADRQSVMLRCLLGAQVRVRALSLPHLPSQSVVYSELPWSRVFEQDDPRLPLPGVLICPIGAETMAKTAGNNRRDDVGYPVLIATIAKNSVQELRTYLPRYTLWREMIARAFRQGRLPGVTEVYDMTIEPGTIVVPEVFHRGIWHSALVVRCISREPRGIGA